jgi:gluconolactonase
VRLVFWISALAWAQDYSAVKIDRVAGGYRYTESPLWGHEGLLLYSEVPSGRVYRLLPNQRPEVLHEFAEGAQGITFDKDGRLYVCQPKGRRVVRIGRTGELEVLAERFEGKRLNAPNDIVVRRDGHVWFTDPAFGSQQDARELDFYGIYHLPPKGELELVARWSGRPNGIALSANGRVLFVANADERSVSAFDVDRRGAATNERKVISQIAGVPGGIRVDEEGLVYVAAEKVFVYHPDGRLKGALALPETPSNLCFGDTDYGALYVTGQTTVYRLRVNAKGAVQYSPQ